MWWQTQHSADFVNWLSIKGLLSQKQACHVARSWFVWYLSTWACKILAWKKKTTRVGRYLKGFSWRRSDQMAEWTSSYSWFFKGQREAPPPMVISPSQKENTQQASVLWWLHWLDWDAGEKQLGPVHSDKIRWTHELNSCMLTRYRPIKRIHRYYKKGTLLKTKWLVQKGIKLS